MLYFLKSPADCTGCTACKSVCPKNCIKMEKDDEGFLYPVASDECVNCGKCEKVCHIANERTFREDDTKQKAYAFVSKDNSVWLSSSSGGAFTEVCKVLGNSSTVVFGAAFEGLKVIHKYVIGVENVGAFRKSKYIESDLRNTYVDTKRFLDEGKQVIWSGTPCQISGLRSFLGKDYKNLFCIDLVCHGVGSPDVFDVCIKDVEKRLSDTVCEYTFRAKKPKSKFVYDYTSRYKLESGRQFYVKKDVYNQMFLSQLILRKSCAENCRYRHEKRMGDITIADLKKKNIVLPQCYQDFRNFSTIVVNSEKGKRLVEQLSKDNIIFECSIDSVKKYNPLFYTGAKGNENRDAFFEKYTSQDKVKVIQQYTKPAKPDGFICEIQERLPYKLRLVVRKLKTEILKIRRKR